MSCQTSVAFGCIVLLTTSTLFFYLYFGVYLRYKFKPKGSGTYDSVLEVAIAFMCVCICAFVITLLLILRCLIKPNIRRQAVSPEGDKLAVNLSSVVVTSPDNRVISSKTYKTRTRISVSPTQDKIPENESIPKILPPKLITEKPVLIINNNENQLKTNVIIKNSENETKPKEIEANFGKTSTVIPILIKKEPNKKEMTSDVKIVIEDTDIKPEIVVTKKEKIEIKKADKEPVLKAATSIKSLEVPPVETKEDDDKFWNSVDKKVKKTEKVEHEKIEKKNIEVEKSGNKKSEPEKVEKKTIENKKVEKEEKKPENEIKKPKKGDKKLENEPKILQNEDKKSENNPKKPEKFDKKQEIEPKIMQKEDKKSENEQKKPEKVDKKHEIEPKIMQKEDKKHENKPIEIEDKKPKNEPKKLEKEDKKPENEPKKLEKEDKKSENEIKKNEKEDKKHENKPIEKEEQKSKNEPKKTEPEEKKREKNEAMREVAQSIQMGKRPAKIEPPFKKPAFVGNKENAKEKQNKYAEKVLANFNPCFPIPKKRSSKSRGDENEKKDVKTEEKTATNNTVQDKTATSLNGTLIVKNKSPTTFKKSATDIKNKSSKSIKLAHEEMVPTLNDTFTIKKKSPTTFKKTATDIKNKASNNLNITEQGKKLGDNLQSHQFPKQGSPNPIFAFIPSPEPISGNNNSNKIEKSEETAKTANTEVSRVVIVYEKGSDTKLGYWGWNYEHWS